MFIPVTFIKSLSSSFNNSLSQYSKSWSAYRINEVEDAAESTDLDDVFHGIVFSYLLVKDRPDHVSFIDLAPKLDACFSSQPALIFSFDHLVKVLLKINRMFLLCELVVLLID